MRIVLDLETNALKEYTILHCAVAINIDTGDIYEFIGEDTKQLPQFLDKCSLVVGHNLLGFDIDVLDRMLAYRLEPERVLDTLVLSRLLNYAIEGGHSLEAWGVRLGIPKVGLDVSFEAFSPELLARCISDVKINVALYKHLMHPKKLGNKTFAAAIECEQKMVLICKEQKDNGFAFDLKAAKEIQAEIQSKVSTLDKQIAVAFPPKAVAMREVTPKLTKFNTLNRSDFRWYKGNDLSVFTAGAPFTVFEYEAFNPGSPSQIVERLNDAGWKPTSKTKGHIEAERSKDKERLEKFRRVGWRVDEENLATLPDTAPEGARKLVERILLAARLRTLEEWFNAYNQSTGRIHGTVLPLGTYTHRASHREPNTGNIAAEKSIKYRGDNLKKLATELGGRMRSLWVAPKGRLLVGTDAEGIQLRIFGHYINDPVFIKAVTSGKKELGTDPHSLNAKNLATPGITRDSAKTFIFAFLLGAGDGKVAEILGVSKRDGGRVKQRFIQSYPGLAELKERIIPRDAERGYTQAIDGRYIACNDEHLMMAVYLQSGESILMKHANVLWYEQLKKEKIWFKQVGWVHDEWIVESQNMEEAGYIGLCQREAIRIAGERLGLRCPMAGETKIGINWLQAH